MSSLPGRTPRQSRRHTSGLVRPRLVVGVDIGGSKVIAGVVTASGEILDSVRAGTPDRSQSPQAVEDTIYDVVQALRERHDVRAVGIGAAGFVDADRASVLFAPHLSWRREPLRTKMAARLELPVVVENDANAAAWAESRFGVARGERQVVCVTLGTGIGGAVISNGLLMRGQYGLAGEFGHMQVVEGGHRCECGNRGCWEQYASGNALVRDARELVLANSPVAHDLQQRVGDDLALLTGPLVTEAAREGDPAAVELFDDVGRWLGVGLANLAAALDPALFVIGGGVSEAGELLLRPARDSFRKTLTGRGYRPEARIERAGLGAEAGLIGAAELARDSGRWTLTGRQSRGGNRRGRQPRV
jgi:glucokinase